MQLHKTLRRPISALRALILATAAVGLTPAAVAETQITFGTYAADKPTETVRKFKPFLNFLESQLTAKLGEPVKIKMRISKEYATVLISLYQVRWISRVLGLRPM